MAAESASTQRNGRGSDEVIQFGDLSVEPPLPAVRDLSVTLYRFAGLRAPRFGDHEIASCAVPAEAPLSAAVCGGGVLPWHGWH